MRKKREFVNWVAVGAAARDLFSRSDDAEMIRGVAESVREESIPTNVKNAATVFIAFFQGWLPKPFKWMLQTEPEPEEILTEGREGNEGT